jgi:phosphatidate cytidylyltransferase
MVRRAGYRPLVLLAVPVASGMAVIPLGVRHFAPTWIGLMVLVMLIGGAHFLLPHAYVNGFGGWVTTIIPVLYVGLLLGHLAALRVTRDGVWWVALVLLLTWAYDTGAYFAGRFLGRHSFMHHVSPNKTWEGVGGGLILAGLVGLVAVPTVGLQAWQAPLLGLLTGIVAQIGDLLESMIKRQTGVKDSGVLIPGHGGLLDRIDSLLFTGVLAYYTAALLGYAS